MRKDVNCTFIFSGIRRARVDPFTPSTPGASGERSALLWEHCKDSRALVFCSVLLFCKGKGNWLKLGRETLSYNTECTDVTVDEACSACWGQGCAWALQRDPYFAHNPDTSVQSGTAPPAPLCMRLQSSFSRIIAKLHLLSHLHIVVPVASPRWTFTVLWNGSNYASVKPGLHPFPCLRIWGNEISMYKQAIETGNSTCTLHQPNYPRRTPVHGVPPALKLGKQKEKKINKQNTLKGNIALCRQMAMALHLFLADPVPGKGHIDAIYRAVLRSKVFKKCFSSAQGKHFKKSWESK